MASFPADVWRQLKNLTARDLAAALTRDGWTLDTHGGSMFIYRHPGPPPRRVSVHMHPGKTFGPKLLAALFADAGWGLDDLRRLKLIR